MKKLSLHALFASVLGSACLALAIVPAVQGADPAPVAAKDGKAVLTPENTRLQFVCAHRAEKPEPRTGTFGKFTGAAEVDAKAKTLKSLTLDIDTNSLNTEFGKLTSHLKSADFFDTREHPKASFVMKKAAAGTKPGTVEITGDLTLHGVTKPIKAPATLNVTDSGFTLTSEFAIDRSEFGMKFASDKVENTVAMTFVIGEKNKVLAEAGK